MKSLAVVGGGTAGFVAALILKTRFPNLKIDVIRSSKLGIVGVGEGSTEHWNEFMKYTGISWRSVIKYCDATFKSGIMFKDWAENDFLHSTHEEFEDKTGQYLYFYARQIANNESQKTMTLPNLWDSTIDNSFIESKDPPFNQYHFDTFKLNDFLTEVARIKGITVIDDEINDVNLSDLGEIESLTGNKEKYFYDFYIDSTGFRKILISKLGAKWISYSNFLKMKSAVMFPTEAQEERNIWTTAQAMDYGWMFNIPVYHRSGNGYIFDSDFVNVDKAQDEVTKFLGYTPDFVRHINFDPGALDKVWIKNCCAIGLSSSFVEPLEASSIGTSIQQAFLLMHRLPNYTENTIKDYNSNINSIMENIRDFVILHYRTKKNHNNFWKSIKELPIPDTLQEKLNRWETNLPIEEDFNNSSRYLLFRESNFIQIMHGLDLFNKDNIKIEYDMQREEIKLKALEVIKKMNNLEKEIRFLSHKKFLDFVRANVQ